MTPTAQEAFRLGDWTVDPSTGSIVGPAGVSKHLEPKVMDVIVYLSKHAGNVVTRESLLDVVWRGRFNADQQLTRAISELRRAFEDDSNEPQYIATIHKRGYRLIPEVRLVIPGSIGDSGFRKIFRPWRRTVIGLLAVLGVASIFGVLLETQRDPAAGATDPVLNSIAVLPFANTNGDPEYQYLSDGISEEVLNLLAQIPELKVIGRTSSFSFRDSGEDVRSIGRKLGVRNILYGSIRSDGERIRVTAHLIDTLDGNHLWSDTLDYALGDVFLLEDEIAAEIATVMRLQVASVPARGRPTTSAEAYRLFLMARLEINRLNWRAASLLLESAIELDPEFAEALELLAMCYWSWAPAGFDGKVAQQMTDATARKALAIDPDLVFARTLVSPDGVGSRSYLESLESIELAYRKQPSNPWVLSSLTWQYVYIGYLEKALVIAQEAADRDPLSLDTNLDLFGAYLATGRTDDALAVLDLIDQITIEPNNWQWTIAGMYLADGDDEMAIQNFEVLLHHYGYTDTEWVRETVTAARDPDRGRLALDVRIPEIAAMLSEDDDFYWKGELINWYLYFGFADRYLELISEAYPVEAWWNYIDEHVWYAHAFHRQGILQQPGYLDFAQRAEIIEVWDHLGPPDFCTASDAGWDCK